MYLNACVPSLQYGGGVLKFFRQHRGRPIVSTALMSPITRVLFLLIYHAQLCPDGHEYAQSKLQQKGITVQPLDNGFVSCTGCNPCKLWATDSPSFHVYKSFKIKQYLKEVPQPPLTGARTETTINDARDFSLGGQPQIHAPWAHDLGHQASAPAQDRPRNDRTQHLRSRFQEQTV
jgi:hypothetical protein